MASICSDPYLICVKAQSRQKVGTVRMFRWAAKSVSLHPVKVIREATREEYSAFCLRENTPELSEEESRTIIVGFIDDSPEGPYQYFYWASTD